MAGAVEFVRYQGVEPNSRGTLPGIFVLVNGLSSKGRLSAEEEAFRRTNNDWYDAAYTNPSHVDPGVYDHAVNPGAVAWFRPSAVPLLARVDGYLRILDAHGVAWRLVRSADPGRVVYEDAHQVVAVPRPRAGRTSGTRPA